MNATARIDIGIVVNVTDADDEFAARDRIVQAVTEAVCRMAEGYQIGAILDGDEPQDDEDDEDGSVL